ncbi:hypothetical protein B5D77_22335 [Microcystis sp. MC19]|nr:hypothetical protein B5D77_22335 [Microcystis sp. MC19]
MKQQNWSQLGRLTLDKISLLPYFWTGAYFLSSCGGVTVEPLKKYVENQNSRKVEMLPR